VLIRAILNRSFPVKTKIRIQLNTASEDSNQTVVDLNGSHRNNDCLTISLLSDSETETKHETENEDDDAGGHRTKNGWKHFSIVLL